MATNDATIVFGTELVLQTSGGADISDGGFVELTSDDRQSTDSPGYPSGLFEFDNASSTPWSAAPTAGAVINIYEQKINSDGADAPDVASTYKFDLIGTFPVKPANEVQKLSTICPVHPKGGKYWLEWLDGGAGTAVLKAGYQVRLIPTTLKPATS